MLATLGANEVGSLILAFGSHVGCIEREQNPTPTIRSVQGNIKLFPVSRTGHALTQQNFFPSGVVYPITSF